MTAEPERSWVESAEVGPISTNLGRISLHLGHSGTTSNSEREVTWVCLWDVDEGRPWLARSLTSRNFA